MNCIDCLELLQQRMDGLEPVERTALELHLSFCSTCRVLQAAAGRLQQGLRLLQPPAPPPGLSNRIAAQFLAEHAAARQRRLRRLRTFAAAAAVLGVMLLAWQFGFLGGSHKPALPGNGAVVVDQGSKPTDPPPDEVPTMHDSMSEVGSFMVSAVSRTADATVAESRALLPFVPRTPLPSLQLPSMETPTLSLREAGQSVSEGLAPVADSARRAFDLFLRDLSPVDLDEKPGL